MRQLTSSALKSNYGGTGGGPPSPEEFFGMSWLSKSQRSERKGINAGGGISNTILAGDAASTRPTFILYVGVPEHSTELQCQICSNLELIDAMERDGYAFLGACHKHDCDAFPSSSANAAGIEPEPVQSNSTNSTLRRKIFTPKSSNFFFWSSGVYEASSANTTLGIVPHTLQMSLAHGRRRNIPQLEIDFMLELDSVRESGQNAILIHPGASVWSAKHIRTLSAFLNLHWDVHVLVGPYQPFLEYMSEISYSFVQAQYVESRTFRLWPGQKREGRIGFDSLEQSTINDVQQLIEENLEHGMHPMEMVGSNYGRHFGRDRTHYVIPLLPDPALPKATDAAAGVPPPPISDLTREHLLDHLLCDMLGFTRSCRIVKGRQQQLHHQKQQQQQQQSPGEWTRRLTEIWERIQVDALAVAAHDRHLERISSHHQNESSSLSASDEWTRRNVRDQIVARLEELGQSPLRDWPLVCMDANQTEALTEYSRVLHDRILLRHQESRGNNDMNQTTTKATKESSSSSMMYAPGMESFVTNVLLCYVDTDAVLSDDDEEGSWSGWFRDLVPGRGGRNPAEATSDPIEAEE